MSAVRHFEGSALEFTETSVDGNRTSICRAIHSGLSSTIGAGIEKLERTRIEWTVTYDEVLFVKEGYLFIHTEGVTVRCAAGDIVWLPKGTSLIYDAPEACSYFYALYPVDWARRQGVHEP